MKKLPGGLAALLLAFLYWFTNIPDPPNGGPLPSPTATAMASPAPTLLPPPSPAATPTPEGVPTPPLEYLCKLPPASGPSECTENPSDPQDYPTFQDAVMSAQDSAEENRFVKNGKVVNELAYVNEVVRILRVSGYCAINGRQGGHTSDDEVWVKNSNSFSEHYDIVTSSGDPWTKYAAICRRAKF